MLTKNATTDKYFPSIGIECHIQLKTKTKLFAAVGNDARGAEPNTLISHICVGMPGALPVLNKKALNLAVLAAFALNTEPQKHSYFERKHYFYPDSPMGYQISQLHQPIILGGSVTIDVDEAPKTININRVQLEADAGKTTHPMGADYSLVDLNRAGTPLLEIVSEPEINSAKEAKAYARELYLIAKYTEISDADLYHGNMRFDVNISVSQDKSSFGKRTEIKNLNSFRSVEAAVDFEIKRQIQLLESGQVPLQETRGWDEAKQKTVAQREKEEAHDYRYFPEPDLPPIVLEQQDIDEARLKLPKMPGVWRQQLRTLDLDAALIETLLDAEVEDESSGYLALVESALEDKTKAKLIASWIVNIIVPLQREGKISVSDNHKKTAIIDAVYELFSSERMHSNAAKAMLSEMLVSDLLPENIDKFAEEQGYLQTSDESELKSIVETVIAENPKAAQDVKNGELKAIGFLVGQAMSKSSGKANPGLVQEIIKKELGLK